MHDARSELIRGESELTLHARARLAGALYLAVNALYIVSVLVAWIFNQPLTSS
jgi:hypothetical protein